MLWLLEQVTCWEQPGAIMLKKINSLWMAATSSGSRHHVTASGNKDDGYSTTGDISLSGTGEVAPGETLIGTPLSTLPPVCSNLVKIYICCNKTGSLK